MIVTFNLSHCEAEDEWLPQVSSVKRVEYEEEATKAMKAK